jgi:diaminohydroxyphosphoribosylaminopyrimidine deaminase/5-amino-6-(5-phosphoribosylamino)uracil reductase
VAGRGGQVEVVEADAAGRVDLPSAAALLGRRDVLQALVEGGGTLHGALLESDAVDRLVLYVAPVLLGAAAAPLAALEGPGGIEHARRLGLLGATRLGDDVRLDVDPRAGGAGGGDR